MLNMYAIEKKVREFEVKSQKTLKDENWKNWKEKHYDEWLQNYRKRIERFVVDVDENAENYEYLFTKNNNKYKDSAKGNKYIGLPHFIFRPYKSEKERVKV